MALTKNEKGEHSTVKIEFSVDRPVFDAAVDKVFQKKSKDITIAGYRKGHAPRSLIEKMYGKGVFYDDALNDVLPDAYEAAVKEAGLEVVGKPKFDVVSMEGNILFSAEVPVMPELDIQDYKGLQAVKAVAPVTDEQVADEIKRTQERNSREIDVTDRPAKTGDTVKFDFEGFIDGKPFEGGKGENHELKLGSGQFIPGFEDQICGHVPEDEFSVNVTFPEDYHAEELRGKPAEFKCKLHKVMEIELPALDDEFAKDVSEFDTYAEYEADVRAKLLKQHEDTAQRSFENELLEALIGKLVADIPEAMIDTEAENLLRDFDNNLRMQGMSLDHYVKYTKMSLDTMRSYYRPRAERNVKVRLALRAVAEKESLVVTEEEIDERIAKLAEDYGMEKDKVKDLVDPKDVEMDVKIDKALEIVKSSAVALDKAPEEPKAEETKDGETKEAPKKKRTTKKAAAKEEKAE